MPLNRDELLAAGQDRPFRDVDTPAGLVRVGVMTGVERHQWDTECSREIEGDGETDMPRLRAVLVCLTVTDAETGERMLCLDDVHSVKNWQAPMLWPIYSAAFVLNRLGTEDRENEEKN
jgi:hypothetical protein